MSDEQQRQRAGAAAARPRAGSHPARPPRPPMTRSRHKVVGGVCAGLGRYFDIDPVIFRVPLAVLSLIGGIGFIAYGIAWLALPYEDEDENEARRMLSGRVEGPGLTALLLIVVGVGLLLASIEARTQFFSVMLLGTLVGAAYWSQHRRRTQDAEAQGAPVDAATAEAVAQTVATAPPEAQAPPVPAGPSWWRGTSDGRMGGTARGYL
ncbi:PspC domain-containing protein, partial [Streptomyces sp. YIM 98790]|uniref:PspC domain-containing protein n=1 Tax=Streptomyces sp. YIM 98790 TaxID=2689077 RepID=UPI001FB669B4